jgi:hypothetical protein
MSHRTEGGIKINVCRSAMNLRDSSQAWEDSLICTTKHNLKTAKNHNPAKLVLDPMELVLVC